MLLSAMQSQLAALYETPIEYAIGDYLITDARLAASLNPDSATHNSNERLLLRQREDSLDISLYIDSKILASLDSQDPYAELNSSNLNDYLIALEGVSHFNYLVWNAAHERQISQLELELQAEVDKFISAMMLFDRQGTGHAVAELHSVFFDAVVFDATLDDDQDKRYRAANHYAGKYCRRLARRYPAQHREQSFMQEIRRFYRLPQHQKIRRIEQSPA